MLSLSFPPLQLVSNYFSLSLSFFFSFCLYVYLSLVYISIISLFNSFERLDRLGPFSRRCIENSCSNFSLQPKKTKRSATKYSKIFFSGMCVLHFDASLLCICDFFCSYSSYDLNWFSSGKAAYYINVMPFDAWHNLLRTMDSAI